MASLFRRSTLRPYPAAAENGTETAGATETASETTHESTFEGRRLDRPTEDIEDQGLAFDMVTVLDRRRFLGALGIGAGAVALAACSTGSGEQSASAQPSAASGTATATDAADTTYTEMPTETAGPYPGDGSNGQDVLDMSGVERSDIRSSIGGGATADGVGITLVLNIIDIANGNAPMTGAAVYVWHCDAEGNYSMYADALKDETYLRGVQVAGSDGKVTFTSIMPGCYSGRWPHIHFEVFPDVASINDATNNVLTSQIAIPQETAEQVYALSEYSSSTANLQKITLASDNVFSDGWDQQIPQVTGDVENGYTISIDVPIDTTTEQQMAAAPGGGEGGGPGGGPGGGGEPPAGGPGGDGGTPPAGGPGGGEPPAGMGSSS